MLCFFHLFVGTSDPSPFYVVGPHCVVPYAFCCDMSCSLSVDMDHSFSDKQRSMICVELDDTYCNTVFLHRLKACLIRGFLDPGTLQTEYSTLSLCAFLVH